MTKNERGLLVSGAWFCAGFALLLGCSARDESSTQLGTSQNDLRKPTQQAPTHGRRLPGPPPDRGHGHGPSHGPGSNQGNGHGNSHAPGSHPGPCNHGNGNGSGGGANGSGGSFASGGGFASAGTASSSAGSGSGGSASTAGTSFGGFGGGTPGVCGDGLWGGDEQCDDSNATSGDGCSAQCQIEAHYNCDYWGEACQRVVCGDSVQQSYMGDDGIYLWEACDDGNANPSDGCSATCEVEPGFICDQPGIACRRPVCGDSRQDAWYVPGPGNGSGGGSNGNYYYEECDDGNAASGDGCTSTCTSETGWVCPQPGVACHQPQCGDGYVDFIASNEPGGGTGGSSTGGSGSGGGGFAGGPGYGAYEACDDGNTTLGDGCNAACAIEPGWNCDQWAGGCHVISCGDGFADYPAEQCDDANSIPNDGCTDCVWDDQGGVGGTGGFGAGGFGPGGFGPG